MFAYYGTWALRNVHVFGFLKRQQYLPFMHKIYRAKSFTFSSLSGKLATFILATWVLLY